MTEAEIYRKAAQLIRERGWFGGNKDENINGRKCLYLAISNVVEGVYSPKIIYSICGPSLVAFNDSSSKNDVLAALEIAEHLATPTPEK